MRDRRGERGRDVAAHDEAAQHLRGAAKQLRLVLTAEHLDHLVAFDGFLQHMHHVAEQRSASRDMRRRRLEIRRTVSAMGGPMTSAISVSFQLR